jgi:hypothetical protein
VVIAVVLTVTWKILMSGLSTPEVDLRSNESRLVMLKYVQLQREIEICT